VSGLGDRLEGKRVVVVAGSGGVGKTTTSAALALGLAALGDRVAVITIDPARRLATALGVAELRNQPQRVPVDVAGELWAMQLDAKRTFDDLVGRLAPDERTREEVLGNRIYRQLSSAVAGIQEFSAVAKLYELDREGGFDVLVLDTPPSRNALDFLDAPDRLVGFFEGRALRLVLTPTGVAARVVGRGAAPVLAVLRRLTGAGLLEELAGLLRALSGLLEGFRARALAVKALLADPATTFLIVSSPEREAVEEAIFFRGKLREAAMPFGGLVVNRVHRDPTGGADPDAVRAELAAALGDRLARKVADALRETQAQAARDAAAVERLSAALGEPDPAVVPELEDDVHDMEGLRRVEAALRRP
jgi:anion-transporting  ArsA/GET3 family ATPase